MGGLGNPFGDDDFATWITASETMRHLGAKMGHAATMAILDRLKVGLVQARAEKAFTKDKHTLALKEHTLYPVPSAVWEHLSHHNYANNLTLWASNDQTAIFSDYAIQDAGKKYQLFGVRFDPEGVRKMVAIPSAATPATRAPVASNIPTKTPAPAPTPARAPTPAAPTPVSRAGRPRKDFWDDLIIATCRAIWLGDLKPQTQADIERWMLDWAAANRQEISETSVKAPAKKVFNAFQD